MSNLLLTSGYNFEGYAIKKYLGICSGECVLGTGFFSTLEASFSDTFGIKSNAYADKMRGAKEEAVECLEEFAKKLGANAIIGVDIDYNVFSADLVAVSANGTAVYIEPILQEQPEITRKKCFVSDYNTSMPIYPAFAEVIADKNGTQVKLSFLSKDMLTKTLSVDIAFFTIFGKKTAPVNIKFLKIEYKKYCNGYLGETEFYAVDLPLEEVKTLAESASVYVDQIIFDDVVLENQEQNQPYELSAEELLGLRRAYGVDAICNFAETESEWQCVCGTKNKKEETVCGHCGRMKTDCFPSKSDDLFAELEEKENARQIHEVLTEKIQTGEIEFSEEVLKKISGLASSERIYGNMKNSVLDLLRKEWGISTPD